MKKLILCVVLAGSLVSCQAPAEKESEHSHESTVIGYEFSDEGEKQNLIAGDVSIIDTYMEFIQAHNDRDIDKIMDMVQDSILIKTQDAQELKGKSIHREVLEKWFPESNPMWTVRWMATNTVEVKDAAMLNGMLKIFLERIIPEHKKPKKIEVKDVPETTSRKSKQQLLTEDI